MIFFSLKYSIQDFKIVSPRFTPLFQPEGKTRDISQDWLHGNRQLFLQHAFQYNCKLLTEDFLQSCLRCYLVLKSHFGFPALIFSKIEISAKEALPRLRSNNAFIIGQRNDQQRPTDLVISDFALLSLLESSNDL